MQHNRIKRINKSVNTDEEATMFTAHSRNLRCNIYVQYINQALISATLPFLILPVNQQNWLNHPSHNPQKNADDRLQQMMAGKWYDPLIGYPSCKCPGNESLNTHTAFHEYTAYGIVSVSDRGVYPRKPCLSVRAGECLEINRRDWELPFLRK